MLWVVKNLNRGSPSRATWVCLVTLKSVSPNPKSQLYERHSFAIVTPATRLIGGRTRVTLPTGMIDPQKFTLLKVETSFDFSQAAASRDAVEFRRRRRSRGQDGQVRVGPRLLQRVRGRPGRGRRMEGGAAQLQRSLEERGDPGEWANESECLNCQVFQFPINQVGYYLVKSPSRKAKYPRQVHHILLIWAK